MHEVGDRRPTGNGTAETTIQIDGTTLSAGGRELKGAAERRLAFYLMWNGKWPETEHDDSEELTDGLLTHHRFRYEPEEWPHEQGLAIVGFYSELFARSFWLQTSDEGVVTTLTADLDPRRQGFVIPDDYQSDELPLWRMLFASAAAALPDRQRPVDGPPDREGDRPRDVAGLGGWRALA